MSGSRTKALRRELTRLLGHAPRKAVGHVSMRSKATMARDKKRRMILTRVWEYFSAQKAPAKDDFRFFKRHGITQEQQLAEIIEAKAARERHRLWIERNNQRLAELRAAA